MDTTLKQLIKHTTADLHTVWDDIGVSPSDRDQAITTLFHSAIEACKATLETQLTVQQQYTEAIELELEGCKTAENQLGRKHSPWVAQDTLILDLEAVKVHRTSLESECESRESDFVSRRDRITHLAETMGEKNDLVVDDDLSDAALAVLDASLAKWEQAMLDRETEIVTLGGQIAELFAILGISDAEVARNFLDTRVQALADAHEHAIADLVHSDCSQALHSRFKELDKERSKRAAHAEELDLGITTLWNRFSTAQEERDEFTSAHSGLSLPSLEARKQLLSELEERKLIQIRELIGLSWSRVEELWETCGVSEEYKQRLMASVEVDLRSVYTEEVLNVLDAEVSRMENRYQSMQPLFSLHSKLQKINEDKTEYENGLKDPNRFKIPGRALQEERTRKRIARIPKIRGELVESLKKWQQEFDQVFVVKGESLLESLEKQASEAPIRVNRGAAAPTKLRSGKTGAPKTKSRAGGVVRSSNQNRRPRNA